MKLLMVFFFIGASSIISASANQPFYFTENAINFTSFEVTILKKFVNADGFNYLKAARNNFDNCTTIVKTNRGTPHNPMEDHEGFCQFFKNEDTLGCLENLLIDLLPALTENEIYLQQFLWDAYYAAHDELCGTDGISNIQYIYNTVKTTEFTNCLHEVQKKVVFEGACASDLNIFKYLDKEVLNLEKESICKDLEIAQDCLSKLVVDTCGVDHSQLLYLIFNPFSEDCINTLQR